MKLIAIATAFGLASLAANGPAAAWAPGPAVGTIPSSPEPVASPPATGDEPPTPPSGPPPAATPLPAPAPGPALAPAPEAGRAPSAKAPAAQRGDTEAPGRSRAARAPAPGRFDVAAGMGELLRPSLSPRRAHPISLAFVAGVFAATPIPFPLPHVGFTLGVNLGPWLMIEGGVTLPIPLLLLGGRVFFSRGEVAGYAAARQGRFGSDRFIFAPALGVDVSRDDGTYAFAEAGLIWGPQSSFTVNQVGNAIGTIEWVVRGASASFGLGKRF